jgi:aromatic-amino-acid transaminase
VIPAANKNHRRAVRRYPSGMESEAMMFFGEFRIQPADPLLSIMGRFAADPRSRKMDLGVGVYRDDSGRTPVLAAVKDAERRLLQEQQSKSYLGSEGDPVFVKLMADRVFGAGASAEDGRLAGLQTPGGTGALLVAAELLAMNGAGRKVWLGTPTWPNHVPILAAAGLEIVTYELYEVATRRFRPDRLFEAIERAQPGDVIVLHGCCHNPTGADLDLDGWRHIADRMAERGLIPLIDLAYQGLGMGWDEDAAGTRLMLAGLPGALVAYSCDKNFGLYRDRVGALFVQGPSVAETQALWSTAVAIARRSWSMPPDHGAAVVRLILEDPALTLSWQTELSEMRARIARVRAGLAAYGKVAGIDLSGLAHEHGMFAMLPIGADAVERLREEAGIYMASSGRINLAGLQVDALPAFVAGLRAATEMALA